MVSRNKDINIKILKIKRELIDYKKFAVNTLDNKDINNYGAVFDKGFSTCDLMLEIIVLKNTRFLVKNGSVKINSSDFGIPIFEYCTGSKNNFIPLEARNILDSLKDSKILLLTQPILDYGSVAKFTDILDQFIIWFCHFIDEKGISNVDFTMDNIRDFLVNENIKKEIDVDKFAEHDNRTKRMENTLNEVDVNVKEISEQLKELTGQITSYQTIISNILEKEDSGDEIDQIINERVIQTFADTVSEGIIKNVTESIGNMNYSVEEKKLINTMGVSAWNKLSDSSKTFLITSKVMYNDLIQIGENIDFSGVCILITKALEVEMKKRFFDDFLDFQKKKYGNNYSKYHTALLFDSKNGLIPLKSEKFTMGSIPFAMGKENWNDSANKKKNNHKCLMEYVKSELMPGKTDSEITTTLKKYREDIEKITKEFRNPSAHTNELGKIDALKCFNIVIDVEKLLKNILDSFVC